MKRMGVTAKTVRIGKGGLFLSVLHRVGGSTPDQMDEFSGFLVDQEKMT